MHYAFVLLKRSFYGPTLLTYDEIDVGSEARPIKIDRLIDPYD